MQATFDAVTGALVQPASGGFLLILVVAGLVFHLWAKKNHTQYEALEDAFKAQLADLKKRAGDSFPAFAAELQAKFDELRAKLK